MSHFESGTYRKTDRTIDLRLGTIVMDDPSGDTKSVDNMMSDEINHVGGFNFNKQNNLCSLWEVISYRKNESMIFSWRMTDWLYYINSPSFE